MGNYFYDGLFDFLEFLGIPIFGCEWNITSSIAWIISHSHVPF